MTGIIFNTENEAIAFKDKINENVSFMFKGKTNSYSYVSPHKDGTKFAVPIEMVDVNRIDAINPEIIDAIGRAMIDNVVEIPLEDWVEQEVD